MKTSALLFLLLLGLSAQALTIRSNGTGGGRWDRANSWAGPNIPGALDSAIIENGDNITVRSAVTAGVVIAEGAVRLRVNTGFIFNCTAFYYDPQVTGTRLNFNIRGNMYADEVYFLLGADTSNPDLNGAGHLSITNDLVIESDGVAHITELRLAIDCRDLIIRTLTGGNTNRVEGRDSLIVGDIKFDVQGTSIGSDTKLFLTYTGTVITMDGTFSFTSSKGEVESSSTNGILILEQGAELINYTELELPAILIRNGTVILSEDILTTNFRGDITIDVGATFSTNGHNLVIRTGDLIANGSFSMNSGDTLYYDGGLNHSISGSSSISMANLIVDLAGADTVIIEDTLYIRESLTITDGEFITNAKVILDADGTETAVFGPFGTGASMSGDLILEKQIRNVAGTAGDWRYVHVPLNSVAIGQVNSGTSPAGFYTYGYTGSNQVSANGYFSTYSYTEPNNNSSSNGFDDGWTAETSASRNFDRDTGRIFFIGGVQGGGARNDYSLRA